MINPGDLFKHTSSGVIYEILSVARKIKFSEDWLEVETVHYREYWDPKKTKAPWASSKVRIVYCRERNNFNEKFDRYYSVQLTQEIK
jgi:hypothetical protein